MKRKRDYPAYAAVSAQLLSGPGPHTIAVRLVAQGFERVLVGQGTVERDSDLGDVLRVWFSSARDESLLLAEHCWKSVAESGAAFGCDLLISLNQLTITDDGHIGEMVRPNEGLHSNFADDRIAIAATQCIHRKYDQAGASSQRARDVAHQFARQANAYGIVLSASSAQSV